MKAARISEGIPKADKAKIRRRHGLAHAFERVRDDYRFTVKLTNSKRASTEKSLVAHSWMQAKN
ncbi:hypothetical protein [Caballeronia sp. J97]|uniref:hypothetical protein n=1 Tax=Caballeronia sp. J97 TaxID=2805429 RepID=UPI002AAF7EB8|nr:hypothetical protein [Caballeronia sp. J97]